MTFSPAVQEAINLLVVRRRELLQAVERLTTESTAIDAALRSLTGEAPKSVNNLGGQLSQLTNIMPATSAIVAMQALASAAGAATVAGAANAAKRAERNQQVHTGRRSQPSVRDVVLATLESTPEALTPTEIVDLLAEQFVDDERTEEQLNRTVRTALWNLRKRGQVVSNNGRSRAVKWLPDASPDAEADPVLETGSASVSAPTSEEGGGADDTEADEAGDLDQNTPRAAIDRDHRHGAVLTTG